MKDQVFTDIIKHILIHRIELKQYFQDYDPLKKMFIRKDQFISVLDKIANVSKLSNFESILECYLTTKDHIKYIDFINDIEKFYFSENEGKSLDILLQNGTTHGSLSRTNNLTDIEQKELEQILRDLNQY